MQLHIAKGFRISEWEVYPELNRLVAGDVTHSVEGKIMVILVELALVSGQNKDLLQPTGKIDEFHKEAAEAVTTDNRNQFLEFLCSKRQIAPENLKMISDGRAITGRQAFEMELIDGVGGLLSALQVAGQPIHNSAPNIVILDDPKPKPDQDSLLKILKQRFL